MRDKNIILYLIYQFLFGLYPIIPIMSLFFLAKNLSFGDIGILFAVFSLTGFYLKFLQVTSVISMVEDIA